MQARNKIDKKYDIGRQSAVMEILKMLILPPHFVTYDIMLSTTRIMQFRENTV